MTQRLDYHEPIIEACAERYPQFAGIYAGIQLGLAFGRAEQITLDLLAGGNEHAHAIGEGCTFDAVMIYLGLTDY